MRFSEGGLPEERRLRKRVPERRTFFLLLFFPILFFPAGAKGETFQGFVPESSANMSVFGTVPLFPELAYAIGKNSYLGMEERSPASDGSLWVRVSVRGIADKPLSGHRVEIVLLSGATGERLAAGEGVTGEDGDVVVGLPPGGRESESYEVAASDLTYSEPVAFRKRLRVKDGGPVFPLPIHLVPVAF
jgi:hypothetical protein